MIPLLRHRLESLDKNVLFNKSTFTSDEYQAWKSEQQTSIQSSLKGLQNEKEFEGNLSVSGE